MTLLWLLKSYFNYEIIKDKTFNYKNNWEETIIECSCNAV